jgi:hypothetical protein
MYLIDGQNESTGITVNSDTKEYQVRTLGIINTLLDSVYPASDTFRIGADGKRPYLPDVKDFKDELDLDARCLREILPNGLAAKLLSEENPQLAKYFQESFEQGIAEARFSVPSSFEDVEDYGGIEYGQFGHW